MHSQSEQNMFLIGVYLAVTYFGSAFGINRGNLFTVSDACYQHNNHVINDVYGIMSLTECSTLCAKNNCRSLLFDGSTQRCIIYTLNKVTTPGCGWKYAEVDTVRSHVTCNVPGYSYDPSIDTCVNHCSAYGTTFGTYRGYSILSNNNVVTHNISRKKCMEACIAATAFVCRSVDFRPSPLVCCMSEKTAQTIPSNYIINENYIYFNRNCA